MFVDYVKDYIEPYLKDNLYIAVVFPSRRAGFFLREAFKKAGMEKTYFIPDIFTMDTFVEQLGRFTVIDDIEVFFVLYNFYRNYSENKYGDEIDKLYPILKTMMSDFSDIERMLINPEHIRDIFKDMRKIAGIEKQTVSNVSYIERYLKNMETMEEGYLFLKDYLQKNNLCYGGFCYKFLLELLKSDINIKYDKIVFAGFNALTNVEKELMRLLKHVEKAEFLWDISEESLNDNLIGKFIRSNIELLGGEIYDFKSKRNSLEIIRVSTPVSQGMLVSDILENTDNESNIAIVLPDESLLYSIMESVPDNYGKFNITMGYPFSNTVAYELVKFIVDAYVNSLGFGIEGFYKNDIENIINHFIIKRIFPDISIDDIEIVDYGSVPFLRKINNINDFFNMLSDLILRIEDESAEASLVRDYFNYLKDYNDLLKKYFKNVNNVISALRFYLDILSSFRIPFAGEPLEGIQIMGLLETRGLDFENVILVSVNEGILPKRDYDNTFIPFEIRRHYGLFLPVDEESIYAYYFFRFLEKADNSHLIYYDNQLGEDAGVVERSRFIEYLLKNKKFNESVGKDWEIEEKDIIPFVNLQNNYNAVVIDSRISEFLKQIEYSATSLINFFECPFAFYLNNILRIRDERKLLDDEMDSAAFGTIAHKVLQVIYDNNKLNDFLAGKEFFYRIVKSTNEVTNITEGKNALLIDIIYNMIKRIIKVERERRGKLTCKKLECEKKIKDVKISTKWGNLQLKGIIDRVEYYDDKIVIIDYKTGRVKSLKWELPDKEEDLLVYISDRKVEFQLLFYKYLMQQKYNKSINYEMYVYALKKGAIVEFKDNDFDMESLLNRIFDIIFNMKEWKPNINSSACRYCIYKDICKH